MAIEIISTNNPIATKTVICRNCGTEFRFTMFDTKTKQVSDYTGCKDIYIYINCPTCFKEITVSRY